MHGKVSSEQLGGSLGLMAGEERRSAKVAWGRKRVGYLRAILTKMAQHTRKGMTSA